MEPNTLALSGYYGSTLERYRLFFPPNFKDEIKQKVGEEFYLLISPKEKEGVKFITGGPVSKKYYDDMVKVFNRRCEDDPDRENFFSFLRVSLDNQRRLPLNQYLCDLVSFEKGKVHYFFGYGDHFNIYKLDDIPNLVGNEISELIMKLEQSK